MVEALEEMETSTVQMISVMDFNPGGFSIEAAGVDGLSYYGLDVELHRVIDLRAITDEDIEIFKSTLVEAIVDETGEILEVLQGTEKAIGHRCRGPEASGSSSSAESGPPGVAA